jgi:hypothetical protein
MKGKVSKRYNDNATLLQKINVSKGYNRQGANFGN